MSSIHEECGVFGVFGTQPSNVAYTTYCGLFALQHRGQEGCGMTVNDDGVLTTYKDVGLVNEVFTPEILERMGPGSLAIGHTRYGTTGGRSRINCQPLEVNHIKGVMSLVHNGNLTNAAVLRNDLEMKGSIFHTSSDSEIIAYSIIQARLTEPSIEEAVDAAMDMIEGAYSMIIMSATKLVAVRDPRGMRPLCYGQCPDGTYIVASESCALSAVGAELIRDLYPGEVLVFSDQGVRSITTHCNQVPAAMCVFEYIYFSRPDSIINGVSVQQARLQAGAFLAEEHPVDADIVIGVPDSGLDAAMGYARASGIPYGTGLVKNRYVARTFIEPGQSVRENKVRMKLNPVTNTVKGKRVVLVDDSIVRGTTSRRIINLLREAGVSEVHMRISAPPFTNPCYYGIDIDSTENLIACHHSTEEIAREIGADSLGYLSVDSVKRIAAGGTNTGFCTACFDGEYPTAIPTVTEKFRFERRLSERKK
ncbi:MAG: amidophosphoribosyltransferase [Oscillospiraceae bacterium]|nr:amidophosphoribosyltransferase [Oscillospiraceae bacterium]